MAASLVLGQALPLTVQRLDIRPSRRSSSHSESTDRQSFFDTMLRCLGGAVGLVILPMAPVRSMFLVVPREPARGKRAPPSLMRVLDRGSPC